MISRLSSITDPSANTSTGTVAGATYATGFGTATLQYYDAITGSIVVTTYSASATSGASNIAGTYTFTGQPGSGTATKTLTNGTFDVKY